MSITTTTVHAPVELTRRRLSGLLAAVAAATAAVTWTVTATAIDNDTAQPARAATTSWQYGALNPLGMPLASAADATVAASAGPIVVADAYHGAGFVVCPNGELPVAVADAYHGTGTTVCP